MLLREREVRDRERFELLQSATHTTIRSLEHRNAEQFQSQKDAIGAALQAAATAVNKAELAAEKRFDGVNEFRATLADQQRTLIPRAEAEVRISALERQISELMTSLRELRSVDIGKHDGWGWALGIISLVAAVLSIAFQFIRR